MEEYNYLFAVSLFDSTKCETHTEYCMVSGKDSMSEAVRVIENYYGEEIEEITAHMLEGGPVIITEDLYDRYVRGDI